MRLAFESILVIVMMISVGIIISRRNWLDDRTSSFIARLVVTIALPSYLILNFAKDYDRAKLISILPGLPIPFILILIANVIALLLVKIVKVPIGRQGTFRALFSFSNAIFIGMPVNVMVFGNESIPYVFLFFIANTSLFWLIGAYLVAKDGALIIGNSNHKMFSIEGVKRIFSPPLIGFLVAIVLILLNIKIPDFLQIFLGYLGSLSTPLSLIFIGIVISNVRATDFSHKKSLLTMALLRATLLPILMLFFVKNLNLPLLMKKVLVIQSAMPSTSQPPIIAAAYGADAEYAGVGVTLSTVLSVVTIPIYIIIVNFLLV